MRELATEVEHDDPAVALRALAGLRAELEREESVLVGRARVAGLSWTEIAACLGVSKQAVHRKHAGGRLRRGR